MERKCTIELDEVEREKLVMMPYHQTDTVSHDHHFFELAYITGGTAVHTMNGERETLRAGDYFIMDYGSVHRYSGSEQLTLINCLFLPELIDDTLKNCRTVARLLQACLIRYDTRLMGGTLANRMFHDEDGEILWLLQGMQREYEEKKAGYREVLRGRLTELLILTLRSVQTGQPERPKSAAVLAVIHEVNQNYSGPLCLKEICEREHYSLSYLSRRFHEETGMTFRGYLQKVRIEKSCEMLLAGRLEIGEIARRAGYEDVKFYHQLFKRMVGMTPGEYRKYGGG